MTDYQLKECSVVLERYVPVTTVTRRKCEREPQPKPGCSYDYRKRSGKTKPESKKSDGSTKLPNGKEADVSEAESIKMELLRKCHSEATENYEKLRVDHCKLSWARNMSTINENINENLNMGIWPPPARKVKRALNPNRKPRKELPDDALDPEVLVNIVQYSQKDKKSSKKIPLVMMKEVAQLPPMIHWTETPTNFRVEDGEFLANYPYLGEDMDAEFENELYDLYDEKDFNSAQKQIMPDEVFLETINEFETSLINAQMENSNRGSNSTSDELARIKRYGVIMPSRSVFSAMSNCFEYLGFPYELEERYAKICKEAQSGLDSTDNLPDTPNVDESLIDAVDPDKALSTYQKLFCPRCLVYCCITHDADDHVDPKYHGEKVKKLEREAEISCDNPDCIEKLVDIPIIPKPKGKNFKKGKKFPPRSTKTISDKWTPHEITMCKLLFRTAKHRPCYISSIMATKTCRQIKDYLQSELGVIFPLAKVEPEPTKQERKNDAPEKYDPRRICQDSMDSPHYRPCLHTDGGSCNTKNMCCCVLSSTFCERWCSCPIDCPRRFKGCKCKATCGTIACPCYRANRECDPSTCLKCGSENPIHIDGRCQNVGILHHREKPIELKRSTVAGWGGFIGCDVKKWELVAEYRGEVISQHESSRRGLYYDKIRHTYLFNLNEDLVVDATRIGSKVRFVNSSKNPNCYAKVMMVHGDHRIGIYAKRNLKVGEELFFDYENIIKKSEDGGETSRRRGRPKSSKTEVSKAVKSSK